MKNLLRLLIVILIAILISTCCKKEEIFVSQNDIYNSALQPADTIFIVTEPGSSYEIRVLPDPTVNPDVTSQIFTSSGGPIPIRSIILFGPSQDTVHMSLSYGDDDLPTTIECLPGTMVPIPCVYEPSGTLWVPCVDGREIVCDQDTVHYVE